MNHELQISLFEDDIKCTLDSILEFCEVEFACIHSLNDNQPFVIGQEGSMKIKPKTWSTIFDSLFNDGNHFKSTFIQAGQKIYHESFLVKNHDGKIYGVISVLSSKEFNLNSAQKKLLDTAKISIRLILEKMDLGAYKSSCMNSMLQLNNEFYLKINSDLIILEIGPNFLISLPKMKVGDKLTDFLIFQNNFEFKGLFENKTRDKTVYFFNSVDHSQRYKFSYVMHEGIMVIGASPVINTRYSLSNYKLRLDDFSKHDYIAEFMFLQQTSEKSLSEAREISKNLVKKNVQIKQAQKEIEALSKFPSENPNPILRFNYELELIYGNTASEKNFISDFKIDNGKLSDRKLKQNLKKVIESETSETFFETRLRRHYTLTVVFVEGQSYINIYANDISDYVNQVNRNEASLIKLKNEIQEQKEFYEFILDNLPADIAVFDTNHKYVYINPKGIKDEKIRSYMIGKDDFDYYKMKNLPNEKAHERRKMFNSIIEGNMFINWTDEFSRKNGVREVIQRSMGPLFDDSGNVKYVIGYGTDITKRVVAEEENVRLSLVARNTNNGVVMLDKDRKITWANNAFIKRSGYTLEEIVGKDSSYFDYPQETLKQIKQVKKALDKEKKISLEILRKSKKGMHYWVDLNAQPLWDDKDKISGYMLVEFDITDRKQNEETIRNLNTNLEKMVEEETSKNLDLSNSLKDQEKMVTLGELAAGVAHDLNTPLGAIRSGAENIKYTLTKLFNEDFDQCTVAELNFALNYSENKNLDLFLGGTQFRKETLAFVKFLETHPLIKNHLKDLDEMAMLFVKNRIHIKETEAVEFILKSKNPRAFLTFLYDFQILFSFVETIQNSGERASLVIQDLRSFIKEKKNTQKGKVNLRDNIQTVLNIFNHNIKNNIELTFEVDENIQIKGFDVRLFQLWSNLIKNAIESMEEMTEIKNLKVYSKMHAKTISVIVENNGPMIPNHLTDKIFDKFYTTKGNKNGSGLGLSIVKNVLEEHDAKIAVTSTKEKTQFKITFKK
jgi:PAS domain S-box-containing protein